MLKFIKIEWNGVDEKIFINPKEVVYLKITYRPECGIYMLNIALSTGDRFIADLKCDNLGKANDKIVNLFDKLNIDYENI